MDLFYKLYGKILYGIAKAIEKVMDGIINLLESFVAFVKGIFKTLLILLSMGGCLVFILLMGPLGSILLNPVGLFIFIFLLFFPIIGSRFVTQLKYFKYITTEYLFNTSNYYIDGLRYRYIPFNDFKERYKKAEEARKREEQRRYYEQQQEWFNQWYQQQQNSRSWQGGYYTHGGQGNYGNVNPSMEFKNKYEKSCQILGVASNSDKNQIKVAYRKLAKEYHPDVNKSPDATKKFQEISDAYNFLSDENMQRYKGIVG